MLQMEDIPKAYLMFLGRPWLKQANIHHDWGNNTLTIMVNTKIMTLSIDKRIKVHPSQKPCNLDDTYDWEGGLTNGNEECFYHVILELWHVRKLSLEILKFLPKIYVGMVHLKIILIILFTIINMNLEKH
jgi:hypothetical protein